MKSVFVGNLSFDTTEGDLRALFEPFGEIARISMISDRETGRPRGFAFVEMADDSEAAQAMTGLNGREVAGRALHVNEAAPRLERSRPRGRSDFGPGAR
jgi:RNA recognition motif-containing protein